MLEWLRCHMIMLCFRETSGTILHSYVRHTH
jgi:hypothetical protein